jgi:hypothetical protein
VPLTWWRRGRVRRRGWEVRRRRPPGALAKFIGRAQGYRTRYEPLHHKFLHLPQARVIVVAAVVDRAVAGANDAGYRNSLIVSDHNLRRGLVQSKSCAQLLISALIRLYTDDVGIGACTIPIVGP